MQRKVDITKTLDWFAVLLFLLLVFFGWINIYASAYQFDHEGIMNFDYRYGKQFLWIMASLALIFIIFVIDSRFYHYFAYIIYFAAVGLLIVTLVIGSVSHGAKSWLLIGGISIQPAEFSKVATALALAKWCSRHNFNMHKMKELAVALFIIFLPAGLIILQNDTGSALVYVSFILVLYREGLSGSLLLLGGLVAVLFILSLIFPVGGIFLTLYILALIGFWLLQRHRKQFFVLLFISAGLIASSYIAFRAMDKPFNLALAVIATAAVPVLIGFFRASWYKEKHLYALLFPLIIAFMFTASVDYFFNEILSEHQRTRIDVLLGLQEDIHGAGYNVYQSKIAIGSGGFTGKGFLRGTQTKLNFVPEQSTDFIFCTVGEEWGFIGTTLVILAFITLLIRLLILAERQRLHFARIYGYGVVAVMLFHFAVNIGMTIGLAPVIGIPLPFFSYGGSSLWGFTLLLFIMLRLDASRTAFL